MGQPKSNRAKFKKISESDSKSRPTPLFNLRFHLLKDGRKMIDNLPPEYYSINNL